MKFYLYKSFFVLFFCFMFLPFFVNAKQKITLINNGKSDYVIIIPAAEDSFENKAANELQRLLLQCSHMLIPIRHDDTLATNKEIVIGNTNRNQYFKADIDSRSR